MTDEGQIIGESDFKIIDKDQLEGMKENGEINLDDINNNIDDNTENEIKNITSENKENGNLRDDLIELGFLDYDKLSEEDKMIFDEMKNEKRDDFYELD